jgi:toxin ParE1/3/4
VTRYRAEAIADLDELVLYTREVYGDEQAGRYVTEIEAACRTLDRFAGLGRPVFRHPDLRQFRVLKHVLFYRADAGDVEIIRILHEARLHESLL